MRALAAATALFFIATPALAASAPVEAVIKRLHGIGADPAKLAKFCKVMQVVENLRDRIDKLEDQVNASLEQALGENFKAYREAADKIDNDADEMPDRKALFTALDDLSDKCPN